MKTHFRFFSFLLFIVSMIFAYKNDIKTFFLLLACSLEIYSLCESKRDWSAKINFKDRKTLGLQKSYTSATGKISEIAAFVCLVGFFVSGN